MNGDIVAWEEREVGICLMLGGYGNLVFFWK